MSNNHFMSIQIILLSFILSFSIPSFADWEFTNGPTAGAIRGFAVQNDVVFCCTSFGGVFAKSNDVFVPMNSGLMLNNYEFVAMANIGNTLFAAHYNKGVFRLDNNATQWTEKNYNGLTTTYIKSLLVKDKFLFAGTEDCVFLTSDNGDNWERVSSGLLTGTSIVSMAQKDENIFAGTDAGKIFKSTTNGNNWTEVGQLPANVRSIVLHGSVLFAASGNKAYKSDQNGSNWTEASSGLVANAVRVLLSKDGNLFAGTSQGLYISTNDGASWGFRDLSERVIYSLFDNDKGTVYAGCDDGAYSSDDDFDKNRTIENGTQRLGVRELISLSEGIYCGTSGSGVFAYNKNSGTFQPASNGLEQLNIYSLAEIGSSTVYAGTDGNRIYNWNVSQPLEWTQTGQAFVGSSTHDLLNRSGILYAARGNAGVYKYNQQNQMWEEMNSNLNGTIFALTSKSNKIYAGGRGVMFEMIEEQGWTGIANGLSPNGDVLSLLTTGSYLYAGSVGSFNEVQRTELNSINWVNYDNNLNNSGGIYSLIRSNNYIIAGAFKGVYIMRNEDGNWTEKNSGFDKPLPAVFSLIKEDKYIWAGTIGNGVWRMPISDISTNVRTKLILQGPNAGRGTAINYEAYIDTVKLNLRAATSPYAIVDFINATVNELDTGIVCSFELADDGNYYIEIDHRNSLATWSSLPISLVSGNIVNYDFTTSAGQAYGSNMTFVNGRWSVYSGDINKDGAIDGADIGYIDNDAYIFLSGYVITDLNGDGFVDASDIFIADNNAANFVFAITP